MTADSFAERAIAARVRLAVDDPEGEAEAVSPLEAADAASWWDGVIASEGRATAPLTAEQAATVDLIRNVSADHLADYLAAVERFACRYVASRASTSPSRSPCGWRTPTSSSGSR
jgi:hypothetical protein